MLWRNGGPKVIQLTVEPEVTIKLNVVFNGAYC